jgi:hypothetical protein
VSFSVSTSLDDWPCSREYTNITTPVPYAENRIEIFRVWLLWRGRAVSLYGRASYAEHVYRPHATCWVSALSSAIGSP